MAGAVWQASDCRRAHRRAQGGASGWRSCGASAGRRQSSSHPTSTSKTRRMTAWRQRSSSCWTSTGWAPAQACAHAARSAPARGARRQRMPSAAPRFVLQGRLKSPGPRPSCSCSATSTALTPATSWRAAGASVRPRPRPGGPSRRPGRAAGRPAAAHVSAAHCAVGTWMRQAPATATAPQTTTLRRG
jgi:hypothetical protein